MRGKTNLPKGIIYKDPDVDETTLHWTPNALPISDNLIKALQFGDKIVALGDSGNIAISEDGLYWACRKIGDYKFADMIIVDDTCIIVGSNKTEDKGVITKSQDLVNWDTKDNYLWDLQVSSYQYTAAKQRLLTIAHTGTTFILIGQCEYSSGSVGVFVFASDDLYNFSTGISTGTAFGTYGQTGPVYESIWANNRLILYNKRSAVVTVTADGKKVDYVSIGSSPSGTRMLFVNGTFLRTEYSHGSSSSANPYHYHTARTSVSGLNWSQICEITEPYAGTVVENLPLYHKAIYSNGKYLLFSDYNLLQLDDIYDYNGQTNYTVVVPGIKISNVMQLQNRIICVCEGGVIVTADMEIGDRELTVLPQAMDNTLYIKKTDNVRKLLVKAVTSDIDADIKSENIKAGINILGVTGTYESGV